MFFAPFWKPEAGFGLFWTPGILEAGDSCSLVVGEAPLGLVTYAPRNQRFHHGHVVLLLEKPAFFNTFDTVVAMKSCLFKALQPDHCLAAH